MKAVLFALALVMAGSALSIAAPLAEASIRDVCLTYWYCVIECNTPPDYYCKCRPECPPPPEPEV